MKQNKYTKRKLGGSNKTSKLRVLPKVNCSPIVKGKTVVDDTCYTPSALEQIKQAYNTNHPNNKILATHPKKVLKILRKRIQQCGKEDCWLEQIKDPNARRQLDEILFAPDHPKEWNNKPNAWLSNFDIASVLRQYEISHPEFKLLGPSSIDYDTKLDDGKCVWEDLCRLSLANLLARGKTKLGISFNLDKHDEPGSHWVSMFVDINEGVIFYYDSGLNPEPPEIIRLKEEIMKQGLALSKPVHFKYVKNNREHQTTNTECGMYSLCFIITFITGETDFHKNMKMQDKIRLFTKQTIPDKYVAKYRKIYFNGGDE